MADCRDWLSTLWPSSYKGVPFYFESDKEQGGRGLVIHEFPNRDDPYVEDLGEAPRYYSGAGYVHGDDADSLADALKSALASRGAGPLVVPYFGAVTVHCQSFERATARDQMGYIAFDLKFVRKGALAAFASIPLLQNIAFRAADDLAIQLGSLFPRFLASAPDVDKAATDTFAAAISLVDVLRQSYPIAPADSASLRDRIAATMLMLDEPGPVNAAIKASAAPSSTVAMVANEVIAIVRQFADALPADRAVAAASEIAAAFVDLPAIPDGIVLFHVAARQSTVNTALAARIVRLSALTAYAEATLRLSFVARSDGVTARGEIAERFEIEMMDTFGGAETALYIAIQSLRDTAIDWLSRTIVDLAPVIAIESAAIRPALALAWELYADPFRAGELVSRNRVRHPSFMPRAIVALAR